MKILVWVLVVSSWNSSRNFVEELGPYLTLEDCQAVQKSPVIEPFLSQCVQIYRYFS